MFAGVNAPPAPFVPQQYHFTRVRLLLTGFGSAAEHAELAARSGGVSRLFDLETPMSYVELQKLLDEANDWGLHAYDKGAYVADLSDPVIDIVTEQVLAKRSAMSA